MKHSALRFSKVGKLTKKDFEHRIGRVGLDSNILIDMVLNPLTQGFLLSNRLVGNNVLCTSFKCVSEAAKVLSQKYKATQAEKEIKSVLNSLKISVLSKSEKDRTLSKNYLKKYASIGAHFPDTLILANFKNNGVTHIASIEPTILKVAERIGLSVIKIPNMDKVNEIMFKRALRP